MKLSKKVLSLLLAVFMLFGMTGISVLAETEAPPSSIIIPVTYYDFSVPDIGVRTNPDFERNPISVITYKLGVTANPTEGGLVTGAGDSFAKDTLTPITAVANDGYHFVGWAGDGVTSAGSAITTVLMDADKSVTADFELEMNRVNIQKWLGTEGKPHENIWFTISKPEVTTNDQADAVPPESTAPTFPMHVGPTDAEGIITVSLPDGHYILTEDPHPGFTNNIENGLQFLANDTGTLEVINTPDATPTPSPTPGPSPAPTPPVANVSLVLAIVGPGTASPGSGAYSLGSLVNFTVTPDPKVIGAKFLGWTGTDGAAVSAENVLSMSQSRAVTANFGVPEPVEELPAALIPEGLIAIEPIPAPEAPIAPIVEETVPQAAPTLPKTGGIPMSLLSGIGALITASGVVIGRRRKDKE